MKVKIINEKQNELFKRKEVVLEISSEVTPSNTEVEKWLADNYKTEADAIKIKNILGKFGSQIFKVKANVYESFEDKDSTEVKTKKQREAEKKALEDKLKTESESKKAEAEKATEKKIVGSTEPDTAEGEKKVKEKEKEKPVEENKLEEKIVDENKVEEVAE